MVSDSFREKFLEYKTRPSPSPEEALNYIINVSIQDFDFPKETRAIIGKMVAAGVNEPAIALTRLEMLLASGTDWDETITWIVEWGAGMVVGEPRVENCRKFLAELADIIRTAMNLER